MGFFQEGSESFPAETALKNSCNVKLATSKKQSGTCIPNETHKKEKTWGWEALEPSLSDAPVPGATDKSIPALRGPDSCSCRNPLLPHRLQTLRGWYQWDSPGRKPIRTLRLQQELIPLMANILALIETKPWFKRNVSILFFSAYHGKECPLVYDCRAASHHL